MGTRADFYVGMGPDAEWLGSIAYDGHPSRYPDVLRAETEADYRSVVAALLASRKDATFPEQGWPWPWKDSDTTDYGYCFAVRVEGNPSIFPGVSQEGKHVWWGRDFEEVDGKCVRSPRWENEAGDVIREAPTWPDMTARKAVAHDQRSGALFLGVRQ